MTKGKCKECSTELVSDEEEVCSNCLTLSEHESNYAITENLDSITENNDSIIENTDLVTENVDCGICKVIVREDSEGLFCDVCETWFHNSCCTSPLGTLLYDLMNEAPENVKWFCDQCIWKTEKWIEGLKKGNVFEPDIQVEDRDNLEAPKRRRGRPKKQELNLKRKIPNIKKEQTECQIDDDNVDEMPYLENQVRIPLQLRTKNKDVKSEKLNNADDDVWDNDYNSAGESEEESEEEAWEPSKENTYNVLEAEKYVSRKRTKTRVSKLLGCDICNKGFHKEEDLAAHKLWHSGVKKPYKCPECGKGFSTKSYFEVHVSTHSNDRPFMCEICGKGFLMQGVLNRHLKTAHTDEKPYECNVCDFKCNQKSNLSNHMLTHSDEKPFKCTQCDYACKKATLLQHHMVTHSDERPFGCEVCQKRFKWNEQLKLHMKIHTGEKPFHCIECPQKFATKDRLKFHVMGMHDGDRPFPCDQCDYRAVTKSILDRHMIKHTGEKPFVCDVCGKQLRDGVSLKNHKLIHTGERPLQCKECGKTFRQKVTLRVHMFSHTKEKNHFCTQCGYGAPTKDKIKKHMRTVHSNETPYECDVCGNRYKEKGNLTKHKNGTRGSCTGTKLGNKNSQQKRFPNLIIAAQQKSENTVISQPHFKPQSSSTISSLPSSQTFHSSPAAQLLLFSEHNPTNEHKPIPNTQSVHNNHSPVTTNSPSTLTSMLSVPPPKPGPVFSRHITEHITAQMAQMDQSDNTLSHYHRFAELL